MPVDRGEIRRLAKDPDPIAVIRMIDLFFENAAEWWNTTEPGLAVGAQHQHGEASHAQGHPETRR